MQCDICGRYMPPDPETGYNADSVCPECQEMEEIASVQYDHEREWGDDDGIEYADPRDEQEERDR